MTWKIETLNPTVDRELEALPDDMKARFFWISKLICSHGLEKVGEPYVKHLQGILWEMRLKGRDGISRALYVVAKPKRVVVVRSVHQKDTENPTQGNRTSIETGKGD